jgi:hypothetical protein
MTDHPVPDPLFERLRHEARDLPPTADHRLAQRICAALPTRTEQLQMQSPRLLWPNARLLLPAAAAVLIACGALLLRPAQEPSTTMPLLTMSIPAFSLPALPVPSPPTAIDLVATASTLLPPSPAEQELLALRQDLGLAVRILRGSLPL